MGADARERARENPRCGEDWPGRSNGKQSRADRFSDLYITELDGFGTGFRGRHKRGTQVADKRRAGAARCRNARERDRGGKSVEQLFPMNMFVKRRTSNFFLMLVSGVMLYAQAKPATVLDGVYTDAQ